MTDRPYLVVVRAGETSLHRNWLNGRRDWDLVVSWYGEGRYEPTADETVVNIRGGKGDGLYKTFEARPDLLDSYRYYWLPDDDIDTDCKTINRLFSTASSMELPICQPALTHDSYFSYLHTLASPSFRLRYTTFVEVMVPCLSQSRLKAILPYFENHPSLFGLDWIWTRLEPDNRCRAAIIDTTPVRHTRPIGIFLRQLMRDHGESPETMQKAILDHFGLARGDKGFKCYAGVLRDGVSTTGAIMTRAIMAMDYIGQRHNLVQPDARKKFVQTFRRGQAALSCLEPSARLAPSVCVIVKK